MASKPEAGGDREGPTPIARSANRWWLLFGVWLLYGSFGLVATSLAPLVPIIESDLGLSHAAMGSVLGAWQFVYIFAAVPCGMLLDRIGPRAALSIGALTISASALGRSAASDFVTLVAAVMLFGIGGPIVSAGAPKVIADHFTGSDRGLAMGIYMTGPALGGIVSLTLTHSLLLPAFGGDWRSVLALWAAVAFGAGVFWTFVAPRRSTPAPAPTREGRGTGDRRSPPSQLEVVRELLGLGTIRLVLLMSVGLFTFNHGLNNWLPELLRSGGMELIEAGYWAALPTVVGIFGSLLIPRLATPSRRFAILFGLCIAAFAASVLLRSTDPPLLIVGLLMQGIARSSLMTVLILTLVELPGIGEKRAGTASGLFFSSAEMGGVLGPLSLGLLYDATGEFSAGLTALSAIAAALALATLRLRSLARASERSETSRAHA